MALHRVAYEAQRQQSVTALVVGDACSAYALYDRTNGPTLIVAWADGIVQRIADDVVDQGHAITALAIDNDVQLCHASRAGAVARQLDAASQSQRCGVVAGAERAPMDAERSIVAATRLVGIWRQLTPPLRRRRRRFRLRRNRRRRRVRRLGRLGHDARLGRRPANRRGKVVWGGGRCPGEIRRPPRPRHGRRLSRRGRAPPHVDERGPHLQGLGFKGEAGPLSVDCAVCLTFSRFSCPPSGETPRRRRRGRPSLGVSGGLSKAVQGGPGLSSAAEAAAS
mmetsp:Transcript_22264/g.77165  ORF Transcript_22264/g.77165 Transcript_22264/m.77165 type:complete len:280 (+) Transcript_22264:70-909(+)